MSQVKYEIYKHLNKFNMIFVFCMLIASCTVMFFQYMDYSGDQADMIRKAKAELLSDYANDREKFDTEYAEFKMRDDEYNMMQMQSAASGEPIFDMIYINKKIDLETYGDRKLYSEVFEIINRSKNYTRDINNVLREAYAKIREIGVQKNQYVYEYQIALILHYSDLNELEIKPQNQYGWKEFFDLKTPVIFLVITFFGVFTNIFIVEKRTKIVNVLNICKNGKFKLIGAKLFTISVFSIILTLLFSLSPLVILNFTTGLSDPSQYIQAVEIFEFCPYLLEIWQYLLIFIFVKIAMFLLIALFIAILGQLLDNEIFVFSASLVFFVLNYLLSLSTISSPLFFLKKFNFFDLAFVNVLFERYRALNIFNFHIGFLVFVILLAFVIFIALLAFSFKLKLKNISNFVAISDLIKFRHPKAKKIKLKETGIKSILNFEFKKNLLNKRNISILCAAILAKIIMSNICFAPLLTNEEKIYKKYIADLYGELNEAKSEYIEQERDYINKSLSEYATAKNDYRNGEIDLSEFQGYSRRYNYAESVKYAFEKVEKRYQYLFELSLGPKNYDNIEFIYEYGILKYLFSFFDIVLVLFVVAICADVFSNEYQSGFIMIIGISKNGGKKTFNSKYLFGFITITAMYLIFSAIDLVFLHKNFDMSYLSAGIMSIPEFARLEMNMSIFNYCVLFKIISYFYFVILAFIVLSLSNITKNLLKSVLAALFILFVPAFLEYFGVTILKFMNITSVLNPSYIKDHIAQYIFYLLFAIVLFVKSRTVWVKK